MTDHEKLERIRVLEGRVANAEREVDSIKEELKEAKEEYDTAVLELRNEITRKEDETTLTIEFPAGQVEKTEEAMP